MNNKRKLKLPQVNILDTKASLARTEKLEKIDACDLFKTFTPRCDYNLTNNCIYELAGGLTL